MSSQKSIALPSASDSGPRSNRSIRRATHDDVRAAFELVKEYFRAVDVWVRDTESEFSDYLNGDDRGVWLAFAGKEPVGCIVLHPLGCPPRSGEIKRLYVRPAYRQQGLAEGLVRALEEFAAKTARYEWLYLDSKDDLVTAIRFYERHGYERCDRYNANPQATVFMRKALAGA
ncbi:MAG: GNAT family N-acetyltransferase [Verrucomicrobia bacterium]|nr:GNAT family N-acetyltransferase [Verrucomicrobiota bacterium]MBV8485057.1 GNAT family N-acetyltransferase [Verrucomicrobiota bacterium]